MRVYGVNLKQAQEEFYILPRSKLKISSVEKYQILIAYVHLGTTFAYITWLFSHKKTYRMQSNSMNPANVCLLISLINFHEWFY
jgi:hypothetical protein